MKTTRKILSTLIALVMLLSSNASAREYAQRFWDVSKDHWAFEYIADLTERKVIRGYEDGSFRPEATVTRAEWAKMMVDAAGVQVSDNKVYWEDLRNHWANKYVNAASKYLTGYSDNLYRPDQAVTREDVTVALVKIRGYDTSDVDFTYLSDFTDIDSISNYAKAYVAVGVRENLIAGFSDKTFRGQDTLTRAEAATLMYRAFKHGNANKITESPTTPVSGNTIDYKEEYKSQAEPNRPASEVISNPDSTVLEEPEMPERKPYIVDTIAKAKISADSQYTWDNNDYIYYYSDSKIYRISISNKSTDEIFDAGSLSVDNDEMSLYDFAIKGIYFDINKDRLLITGKYETVNTSNEIKNLYLCEIIDGRCEVLTNNIGQCSFTNVGAISKVLNNGDIVASLGTSSYMYSYIIDGYTLEAKNMLCGAEAYDIHESGSTIQYVFSSLHIQEKRIIEANYDLASDTDTEIGKYPYSITLSDNGRVSLIRGNDGINISIYNYKGKKIKEMTSSDIEINDGNALNIYELLDKKFLTSDLNIIFYDESARSFRILKSNV